MATIRTSIQLQDRLSQPMRAMHSAVSVMVNQMEAMHAASGNMMDTTSIEIARRELARAADAFNQIEDEIREADNVQQRFNNHIRDGTNAAEGLLGKVLALVAAYLSLQSISGVVQLSDEMTSANARVGSINDGLQTTADLQRTIFDSAQRTFTPYLQVADTVGKLAANAGEVFNSTKEIVAFTELLNKSFANANTNAEGIASATLQLNQAMGSGVLRGEELNAVLEAAPGIVQNIEKYLGISRMQLREMASDGEITAEIVKQSMFAAANDINKLFDSMPLTWSQIWIHFKNEALWAFKDVLQQINGIFNSDRFAAFRESASQSLQVVATLASYALSAIASVGGFIYDNWSFIAPIVGTATVALVAYMIALTTVKTITTILAVQQGILAVKQAIATGATYAQIAAQYGLNAALYACPITWIILGIIALVGILYLAIAVVNHFAGTSISATGIVAGAFMVLGTYIYNNVAFWWNIFSSFWEYFANVSKDKTYAVKRLFYNLASNVLDYAISMTSGWDKFATNFVNAIIDGVNRAVEAWNWFISMLPDGLTTKLGWEQKGAYDHRESITSDLQGLKGALGDWVGEAPADYWEAPKMEQKSLGAAWDTGYNWGANLFNSDSKGPDIQRKDPWADILSTLGNAPVANAADREIAGNTAKMAKTMEATNEDLKYLRDMADSRVINRYTTEITVEMKNENHIKKEMDIDGVIDRFGEKVEEVVEMLAEGGPTDNL
ncbi:tape measure protein [Lysinibacillus sphaericus]|uniref:Phage tail tape measure protein n=1 Tax=Lysinibacillus sphaericus OT4b.31 TaxID=1285586 RepID=R7ZIC6_LYSSH|nr:tape measure protein [Lysinibacillus sphaericus]EON73845.1 phage tail tape measure protein [Lysinibacillus sphaericus OT4b.31]